MAPLLESVFNHIVLPPKLPGCQDSDIRGVEHNLLLRLLDACETLGSLPGQEAQEGWQFAQRQLLLCLDLHHQRFDQAALKGAFSSLSVDCPVTLHVAEQNSAILIRSIPQSGGDDYVVFETFEVSPRSTDVLAADGALQWDFPGRAARIPLAKFLDPSFIESLATFVEQASTEPLERFAAHSHKAGASVPEIRDSADPALISQMLLPMLEAMGSSIQVPRLRKRVRDNVILHKAMLPWRRLPFWLVLRVAVQRNLCLTLGNSNGRACYKFLICTLLSQLLIDSAGQLAPELTMWLRSKLCRRLAKLEMDRTEASPECRTTLQQLFDATSAFFEHAIQAATSQVETIWHRYRKKITPGIPRLPLRADQESFRLSLGNSAKYLDNIIHLAAPKNRRATLRLASKSVVGSTHITPATDQIRQYTLRFFKLAKLEIAIEKDVKSTSAPLDCLGLAQRIINLARATEGAFDSGPEQASASILGLFDLWVRMDKYAVTECPLLRDYHPVFHPQLLDVLQLPTPGEMKRLKAIQEYLEGRCRQCRYPTETILTRHGKNNFAARFVAGSTALRGLRDRIEAASRRAKNIAESNWAKASKEYDALTKRLHASTCSCTRQPDGTYGTRDCARCQCRKRLKKLRVKVHEDFLPSEAHLSAAIVFELDTPRYLAAYRDATWTMTGKLAHPSRPLAPSSSPHMQLNAYPSLKPFANIGPRILSLASGKKSFLQSHYKTAKMKVEKTAVLLPHGLDFQLYDAESKTWVADLKQPLTFSHLCGIHIPAELKGSVFQPQEQPHHDPDGPSSYEAIANQTKCPAGMSVHEFLSLQKLFSGRSRRWLAVLAELGSANLNFSSRDTMHVIGQLAIQAGPARQHKGMLRDVHVVFQDTTFCAALAQQIRRRLQMIYTNWREMYCMEVLITLSLRLFHLATPGNRSAAEDLIKMAREATLAWITRTREELWKCTEGSAAEAIAKYRFWASLLCRRTFAIFEDDTVRAMSGQELGEFVQASVALQQSLVVDLGKLSPTLKGILARDMKMAYRIQQVVKSAIHQHPIGLSRAISSTLWDAADAGSATGSAFSQWEFLVQGDERWVTSVTNPIDAAISPQRIHYNFLDGRLLIDGSQIGKLPPEIRDSEHVKELFENQHLLTYPSPRFGMSHVLVKLQRGQHIHFGLRDGQVVVQAVSANGNVCEYVPRHIFSGSPKWDLPLSLIDNCAHWLNLASGRLEIRRKPHIWHTRSRDWVLDVSKRIARRSNVFLVDPHSALGRTVAGVLGNFEDAHRMTIFQPQHRDGNLSVELRNLALNFFVNNNGLLQCRELHAEIDPDQDAGTLYGFRSALVLRGVPCSDERSLIIPLGAVSWNRDGIHVSVHVRSADHYGKFGIDPVLGQLICPPEPRLLYTKALLHALTSFPLPDSLTRRTGTEEALRTLRSGRCQPWQPIGAGAMASLMTVKSLTPIRNYYPRDKRSLQTVTWDDSLTMTIQHESYEPVVSSILKKSEQLRDFSENQNEIRGPEDRESSPLSHRAEAQRLSYERDIARRSDPILARKQDIYRPRDREATSTEAVNVYQITKAFHQRSRGIHMAKPLKTVLRDWELIGGFSSSKNNAVPPLANLVSDSIAEQWGSLVDAFRVMEPNQPYSALFKLSLLSFAPDANLDVLGFFVACYCLEELRASVAPRYPSFTGFGAGKEPTQDSLRQIISATYSESDFTTQSQVGRKGRKKEAGRFAAFILQQWPARPEPSIGNFEAKVLNLKRAMKSIVPEWQRLYRNLKLSQYLDRVQAVLDRHQYRADVSIPAQWDSRMEPFFVIRSGGPVIPSLVRDICRKELPTSCASPVCYGERLTQGAGPSNQNPRRTHDGVVGLTPSKTQEMSELAAILSSFVRSTDNLRQEYGNSLRASLAALERAASRANANENPPDSYVILAEIRNARSVMNDQFKMAAAAFSDGDPRFRWLGLAKLWLWTTPIAMLEPLRSSSECYLDQGTKALLVSYGLSVTRLQRLQRISSAQLRRDTSNASKEWRTVGHTEWNALDLPDWLLLEIDNNLTIRPEQVEVARAMISPASGSNSVLQMNMGSGKTSCIVPMAMSVLANGVQLARLIVPKALLSQTAQIMQARLGGLVGRDITHVPFSRRTPTGRRAPAMIPLYSHLHQEARLRRGIMLTTPEHILSYKLSGLQRLADKLFDEARDMIKFQARLSEICRDILDESDFTLAARTQLIYPSGPLLPLDGHPHRWRTIQTVLSLVEDHLPGIQNDFPHGLQISERPGGFPMAHFLQKEAEDELNRRIVRDISSGRTTVLPLGMNPSGSFPHALVQTVLHNDSIDPNLVEELASQFPNAKVASDNLLLMRGLLVKRILLLCLKKRWNVQYGFHPGRHPVAVPFDAKGVPSEQSEFGHPDVALLLTCLSFYYTGLTSAQFRDGLRHVLNSEDPAAEYDRWTQNSRSLPDHLSHWNAINIDHQEQFDELWERLRLSRSVLNHYMNTFVFPAHARQFDVKIQASVWDLPLLPLSSTEPYHASARSTGFSGTNDNRMLLPLTIKQDDLESLSQTNAEVLTYLLQSRNRGYHHARWTANREGRLLEELSRTGIRVLIDAGAYILEQDNESLVKLWLAKDTKAKAAVYLGADNRPWVHYRDNKMAPLIATPFAEDLDECLVYLDEAHTRGIDLKLPRSARGALTLALGQTKDHTVQAAMRLRELGSTQAVVFFAPPEVHQSIVDVCKLRTGQLVDSSHVIAWLLEQTCRANEQLRGLYIAQGYDFCRRTGAQLVHRKFLTNERQREAFLQVIRRPERQTLGELYGTRRDCPPHPATEPLPAEKLGDFIQELNRQQKMVAGSGTWREAHDSALEEVEQEREVEFQAEHVQQKQQHPAYDALRFPGLCRSIRDFVGTGKLSGGEGYQHAFDAIASTNTGKKYKVRATGSQLFVSAEYMRTIVLEGRSEIDDFLRPVEWLLWNPTQQTALIVVPEEVELLIPLIRNKASSGQQSAVHLVTYMAPLSREMMHFNDLSFYALPPLPKGHQVPEWLSLELGIFAGKTYANYAECTALKRYMELPDVAAFSTNPAGFLLEWLALRRKGQDVTHTPVGYVCQGQRLREDHHFFAARRVDWWPNVDLLVQSTSEAEDSGEDERSEDGWAMADNED
ncbi:ubiquitinyl hydrolase 1 [Madurella fahalii]|uniref:ubiquitinyl hydrolase 1 n=1 Tax=Madurella fahalii TaxID=1157608 RepID=A0ABQ0GN94_9PEZI